MGYKKPLLFCSLIGMFLFSIFYRIEAVETPIIHAPSFHLIVNENEQLILGDYWFNRTFFLNVTSGVLNSSTTKLEAYQEHGSLTFKSNVGLTFITGLMTNVSAYQIAVNIQGSGESEKQGNDYNVTIPYSNIIVNVSWKFYKPNPVDEYFLLGMGLTGLGLLIFAPCWVTWEVKKHGVTEVAVERFGYAMLLFIVGFGLIVMYLWSG